MGACSESRKCSPCDHPELSHKHKCLISQASTKNCIFVLDLQTTLVYSAAMLRERKSVEARSAFIYADVNTYCPTTPLERKEETHKDERKAATHTDVRAS